MPYLQREKNILQVIVSQNYQDFESCYDEIFAKQYGQFRLERISESVQHFLDCGDWRKGIARIKCANKECGHEMFLPFSCKQWYLCPSCHQKRLLLLSEHLSEDVLLRLPHRQFVFTVPKLFRPYFKHDRKLFAEVSKIIHRLVSGYYREVSKKEVISGSVISHQTYGDMMRFHPHWHCIILEGGIDKENGFCHVKIKNTSALTELFRKAVVKLFANRKLINTGFAGQLLSWKNSGFSVDNSVFLFPNDDKARESLCQYIARHPVSLNKISYDPVKKKVLYHTRYDTYWRESVKLFPASDFIADLTVHIPPKGKHLIRYYGIYASRTKGKAKQDGRYTKFGIKKQETAALVQVEKKAGAARLSRREWARLIQKVYETDPLVCPKCGSGMEVISVIQDRSEIEKIITHLRKEKEASFNKSGRAPPLVSETSFL